LGVVQESIETPGSGKTVIHIQDAHCNYAAQRSIADILGYLSNEYGVYAVNCEGAAEGYDLSVFTNIPEKDIRQKTSDFFVREGMVSAAEYYAANNPKKVSLWGVEDPDLYLKNLKIYRDSLAHKPEVDRYIKSIEYLLDNLKRHIYSQALLELDKKYSEYKDSRITFKEYILYLISTARRMMIDIKTFPNIYLLSQTLEEEDKINFKLANNEKDEVVDKLKKILSRNELKELLDMVSKLKTERISQPDFYTYLVKKAKSVKLDISGYTELHKYVIYISLYGAMDRTKIAKEIDAIEYKIKSSLYENDAQRELGLLSKNMAITKNIFNISLTRDDYIYYKEHREAFSVSNYISFIDKKAPLYKITVALDKNINLLDKYRDSMDQFYECSLERDRAFIKNIKFTDHDRPNSIIITGGFHTENLRELFKDEKVSYISIIPKFKNGKGYESPYMKRLAGQKTALESVINTAIPAVLNLQVVEILSKQIALKVEGEAGLAKFRLAVSIVAALMRGEKFIFKINKDAYPEKARPEEDKVIVFNMGEGGNITYTATPAIGSDFTALASRADATLTAISVDKFEFSVKPQAKPAVALPAAKEEPPVIKPFAELVDGQVNIYAPAEQVPGAQIAVTAAAKPYAESMYVEARNIVPEIVDALRRGSPTYLISPVASEEDVSLTSSNNRRAEQILGKQGHNVHAKSYLAKGDWEASLRELVKKTLPGFIEDQSNPTARMAIRLMPDAQGRIVREIRDIITKEFIAKGYDIEKINAILEKQIHFIPINVTNIEHLNASIDLFTDIGMMEIDRYRLGDYPDEMPQGLKERFLALLKLSITNFDDFKTDDVKMILDSIFKMNILLQIRPVDWKSIDDWKKAQDAILQAV
jgi:hypothetical protein